MPLTGAVMEVCLEGVRFHARHGMLEAERKVGNDFELDIRAEYIPDPTGVADNLSHSLCYAELYALAAAEMSVPSDTLEHVASRIGMSMLRKWPSLTAAEVAVTKPAPPIPRFRGRAKVVWRWRIPAENTPR